MKKIIILMILFYSITLKAQKPLFSVGLTYQPTFYWNYNKSDWNNKPLFFPEKPRLFNGQALGLEMEKNLTKNYNLKLELVYSDQVQKITASNTFTLLIDNNEERVSLYNTHISTRFKYLKIPILLSMNKKLNSFSIYSYLGPQVSVLLDYKRSLMAYNASNTIPSNVLYDDPILEHNFTPYHFQGFKRVRTVFGDVIEHQDYVADYIYKRYVYGVVGGFGLKKVFSEHYYVGLSSRFEYDFTDSESKGFVWGVSGEKNERGKAHNIRIGLSISAGYIFSVQKEKMKKRKN